ncbi:hypothetical protein CXF83_21790 [Shewanella sp. Choline-02u-19]|uniref:hypothetical protein n=1 Tax=unclassified Shewanella TaxID=196818 RepID=UPI000C3259DE|nr:MULTISPECIES: hypothetical protein [unclassified Shewanella]PKH60391.1 hypothetical protein CXF84_02595 [Shewanella sp. Bg11-22]PKI29150.1 hypothetical protein CXF83_21790 [Shewanella sp. Choline-02u-19]
MSNTQLDHLKAKLKELKNEAALIENQIKKSIEVEQNECIESFKKEYIELKITPQQLAKALEFTLVEVADSVQPTKAKTRKKHPLFYMEELNGTVHQTRGSSAKVLNKAPWKNLVLDGSINKYTVRYYKENATGFEYWTDVKNENMPDNATETRQKGVKDIEAMKSKVNSII